MKIKELDLVKTCMEYLEYKNIFHYRQNSGALKTERGGFVRFGTSGAPDIVAVINGQYIGIECKIEKGKLSPSQFTFGEKLVKAGGQFIVVRTLDDLMLELTPVKLKR